MITRAQVVARPVVLTFVPNYLPGYRGGGPIRSISNMVEALGEEFRFLVVTADRDAGDNEPYEIAMRARGWEQVGKAAVLYLPPSRRSLRSIFAILKNTPHDVLYLNSFFSPTFTSKPLIARTLLGQRFRPCVVAPRGEFSASALGLKAWKKRPFLTAMRMARLYEGVTWQASAEYDAGDIQSALRVPRSDIRIAMETSQFTSNDGGVAHELRQVGEPLRVCFLSRIAPMKNLDFALEVLHRTPIPVRFTIYGPLEDPAFWARCRDLIANLPANIQVTFEGGIEHHSVRNAFARNDLLFLPTRGENYGHVIAEALTAGTPVLISDRTPWRNLEAAGVGWDIPLEAGPDAFVEKLLKADVITKADGATWRAQATAFAVDGSRYQDRLQQARALLSF